MQGYDRVDDEHVRCQICRSKVLSFPSHLRRHENSVRHRRALQVEDTEESSAPFQSSQGSSSSVPVAEPTMFGFSSNASESGSALDVDDEADSEIEGEQTQRDSETSSLVDDYDFPAPFSDSDWSDSDDDELPGPNPNYAPFSSLEVSSRRLTDDFPEVSQKLLGRFPAFSKKVLGKL